MSVSKITGVQPNGSFIYQNGPLAGKNGYGFIYKFEDGTEGRCVHMTEQPKFSVGDTVEIEESGNDPQGNRKVKLSSPGGGGFRSGGGSSDGGIGAMVGNSITNAVLLLCHGKAKPAKGEDLTACLIRLGDQICVASETLKKKHTPAKPVPAKPAPQQQSSPSQPQQSSQPSQGDGNQHDYQDDLYDESDVPF